MNNSTDRLIDTTVNDAMNNLYLIIKQMSYLQLIGLVELINDLLMEIKEINESRQLNERTSASNN